MAANYKVNIELDTKKLDKQLRDLGVKVNKVGKVKQSQSKKTIADGDKEVKQELQKIRLKNESLGIETQVKKIKSKILDINKVENNIEEASLRASKGEFDLAKKGIYLGKQYKPVHKHSFYKKIINEKYPNSERYYSQGFQLPLNPNLKNKEINLICNKIIDAIKRFKLK